MDPVEPIRDVMPWPVQPVIPVVPTRPLRDLEAWTASQDESALESQDHLDLHRRSGIEGLIHRDVVVIESERTLPELEALLLQHHISGVPVVEAGTGELLGVVSQSDIVRHLSQRQPGPSVGFHDTIWFDIMMPNLSPDSSQVRVKEIMTPYIHFATEDATVAEVLDLMLENHIHRVVITRQRRLVGVVTSLDLLRLYRRELED